jgi:hypothetical protein
MAAPVKSLRRIYELVTTSDTPAEPGESSAAKSPAQLLKGIADMLEGMVETIATEAVEGEPLTKGFGQMYVQGGVATFQPGLTAVLLEQWTANGPSGNDVVADFENSEIVVNQEGVFKVSVNLDYQGTNNSVCTTQLYMNDVAVADAENTRKLSGAADIAGASINTLLQIAAEDLPAALTIKVNTDGETDVYNVKSGQMVVHYITENPAE